MTPEVLAATGVKLGVLVVVWLWEHATVTNLLLLAVLSRVGHVGELVGLCHNVVVKRLDARR